jgi:EAL domain-containing protein (putative c-di-GMP-specific phosphodiesterase class I)
MFQALETEANHLKSLRKVGFLDALDDFGHGFFLSMISLIYL